MLKYGRRVGNMRDNEIFKKEILPVHELDAESCDGVNDVDKMHLAKQEKPAHSQCKHKNARSSRNKDSLKHKRKKDKNRNLSLEKSSPQFQRTHERKSFISKNRLTRSIGIYNKGKKSETIYREERKSRFFNKVSNKLKEKTNKDISKVLDCSSFQIKPCSSSYYAEQINQFGFRPETNAPHLSEASHASPPISSSQVNNMSPSPLTLIHKTPLEDIAQKLINTMKPLQTFNRDYLQEVCDELKGYYRKSTVLNHKGEAHQSPTVTPVLLESTCHMESKKKLFMSSIGKIEHIARQNVGAHQDRISEDQRILKENTSSGLLTVGNDYSNNRCYRSSNAQIVLQHKQSDAVSQSSPKREQPVSKHMSISVDDSDHGNFDILTILGQDLRCTDEGVDMQSAIYSSISPLKKPSLEIASPPGKLFPRKLF